MSLYRKLVSLFNFNKMSTEDWNGFQMCGYNLPDIALENLLASVPIKEILKLRQVLSELN